MLAYMPLALYGKGLYNKRRVIEQKGRPATVGGRDVEVMEMMKLRIGMMWTMGLLTVAVVVMLTGVFNLGTAAAAADDSRVGAAVSQAGSGDGSVTAFTPAIAEGQGALQSVWSATLTVAEWDAGDGTAWGYLGGDEVGELSDVAFLDRGARYVVKGIFQTHLKDDTYVLDIVTDTRLRSDHHTRGGRGTAPDRGFGLRGDGCFLSGMGAGVEPGMGGGGDDDGGVAAVEGI